MVIGVKVKIQRYKLKGRNHFETQIENLYAIGEGAGINRGWMQATVTGSVVARDITAKEAGK